MMKNEKPGMGIKKGGICGSCFPVPLYSECFILPEISLLLFGHSGLRF